MKSWAGLLLVTLASLAPELEAVTVDFEGFPDQTAIHNHYLGDYGIRLDGRIVVPKLGTSSGSRALEARGDQGEFHPGPVTMTFVNSAQSWVKMRVGLHRATTVPVSATLTAHDANGKVVGVPATVQIGPSPTPIATALPVDRPPGQPGSARIAFAGRSARPRSGATPRRAKGPDERDLELRSAGVLDHTRGQPARPGNAHRQRHAARKPGRPHSGARDR